MHLRKWVEWRHVHVWGWLQADPCDEPYMGCVHCGKVRAYLPR
jgi:hypothetical protein